MAIEITDNALHPHQAQFRFPVCLVIGDEMAGVSGDVLAQADCAVAIPMLSMGNSLSVVSALSIVVYEASLRRIQPTNSTGSEKRGFGVGSATAGAGPKHLWVTLAVPWHKVAEERERQVMLPAGS